MQPITTFSQQQSREIKYILTDIDDTLTHSGRIPACAFEALENLKNAGIILIPITGRPAGWCDLIARMWPVDGVVGENGALYFAYDEKRKKMTRKYVKSEKERINDRIRLSAIQEEILTKIPQCAVSADQHYREADLAIDFCEDVSPLPEGDIIKIVEIFENHGATAKISSIHVNGWFGSYDKLSMTKIFFRDLYGLNLDDILERVIYAGDSPNDEPMFEYFPNSVGVANVLDFADILTHKPTLITKGEGGYGFTQMANHLLSALLPSL
jgi:HAD superfamily hydrolase (TIGR01484 family)